MASFVDVCRFRPVSTGTGDFVVSAAVTGYQMPAAAGAVDGKVYRYRAETTDLSSWEVGYGIYTVSTTTLARTTILYNSLGTTAKINFLSRPNVGLVILAMDIASGPDHVVQDVTVGASASVNVGTSILRVNKASGSATTLSMPLAADKTCDVLIVDWKGDAGTNNITVNPGGSEKINGLSSWTIAGDNGSIFMRRIPGVGYAI